ncbi:MAG: hypothetical protein Q8S73_28770 [Deltaproteobacteria bacterium]|nr:hypothetical protein [Myxococcales bacterium]MDP3218133.1 hypothetical protein [Deltaproteobacteria bacterium]
MAVPETFEWSQLTRDQSEILEAYFALFREREPTSIGSGEILQWFRDRRRTAPSESLVRTVLAAVDVPRRGGGRPSNESRAAAPASPPLTTVRPQTPRGRKSPRG